MQFEQVAATARAAGDGDLLARAAIGYAAGLSGFEVRLHDQAQIDLLEEALAALPEGDSALRADVMARLSVRLSYATELPRRVALAEEAVAMTRRIGDARATAHALAAHCDAIAGPDDAERRADDAGEIIRLAARVRDRGVMLLGLRLRVVALLEQGDILGAEADMTAFARVADDLGQPGYSFYVPLWQGFRAHARGDLAEMESCIAEVRRLGERAGSRNAAVLAFVMESWLSRGAARRLTTRRRGCCRRSASCRSRRPTAAAGWRCTRASPPGCARPFSRGSSRCWRRCHRTPSGPRPCAGRRCR